MKIKTKNPRNNSIQLIVPIDGLITIDSDGITDVSTKCAVILVTGTNDWEYAKKNAPVVEKVKDDDEDDEEEEEEGEDGDERQKFEEHLNTLSLTQMKDLAKEGEMPESDYEKIGSKKLMKAYLLKKFDEVE